MPDYLDPSAVSPGFVYGDEHGRRYLCLDGIQFVSQTVFLVDGTRTAYQNAIHVFGKDIPYQYLRWTRDLDRAIAYPANMNDLVAWLVARDWKYPWTDGRHLIARTAPKRFVSEIRAAIVPGLTVPQVFRTKPVKLDLRGTEEWRYKEYTLCPNNKYI